MPTPVSQTPSLGNMPTLPGGTPIPKNIFSSIKRFVMKYAKLFNGTLYNLVTILFSDVELPNSFEWGILL